MAQMELMLDSYNDATKYPKNLVDRTLAPYTVDAIDCRLNTEAHRLFADEAQAALNFSDLQTSGEDFWPSHITNAKDLRKHLGNPLCYTQRSHHCRFLFIHAAHSRDKLKVSREMLMLCFTYFQVMPEFVDFLFPFGFRLYKQDFYFSGFRQRTQLTEHWRNNLLNDRPMGKSFQVCYNLKSVERWGKDGWSIRHCAIHHRFDLQEVRTSWITVKADEIMKERINVRGPQGALDFDSIGRAFNISLETHLIFCEWSAENWRWYINSLEDEFQNMTRRAFSAPINLPNPLAAERDGYTLKSLTNTERTGTSKLSMLSRMQNQINEICSFKPVLKHRLSTPQRYTNPDTGISQPLPPDENDDEDKGEPECSLKPTDIKFEDENRDFSFGKLRKVHEIAEKANEAVLVLKQNINILTQLKQYYKSIYSRKGFPQDLADSCKDATVDFAIRINELENDMQTQILMLETLLCLLEDRKTLLCSILDFRNKQVNKYSTNSMSKMTEDMNDIARKTKIETVSMRVITLVTLFFLPSTFISVGCYFLIGKPFLTTLMSTEIFQPDHTGLRRTNPYAHLTPLQLFFALSLPLTLVTLLFWAGFHFWDIRHEKQKERHLKATNWQA